jgi:hypothetical protein
VLVVLALLVLALMTALVAAGWWNRSTVLVPPSSQAPLAVVPTGDCPGGVRADVEPSLSSGWALAPAPGLFTSAKPGPITALWHEPAPPGNSRPPLRALSVVEVDPLARTTCRLLTSFRDGQAGSLEGASVPAAAWARHGDAFAIFRGDVERPDGCCGPGELLVWWPGGHAVPVNVLREGGNVVWSNRGAWLAVSERDHVHDWKDATNQTVSLYPADGTPPRQLVFDCDPCLIDAASFSPDDRLLAVAYWRVNADETDADQLIAIADVTTGSASVLEVGRPNLTILGWADDRTVLALDGGTQLLAIPVERPTEVRLVTTLPVDLDDVEGEEIWGYKWSPDLSRVALLRRIGDDGEVNLWDVLVLDVRTGAVRHVARESAMGTGSEFVWAPDNRTFAYTAWIDPDFSEAGVVLKVADALEGGSVAIAHGLSPIAWRPVWR